MIFLPLDGLRGIDWEVSQPFGANPGIYAQFGHDGHNGWDLKPLIKGRDYIVLAPHDGYVKLGNEGTKGYGMYVEITGLPHRKEGIGMKSDLAHLRQFLVTDGQYIAQGEPIGVLGGGKNDPGKGFSTGRHLHWTYKLVDALGNTINKGNGKNGAIDVSEFTLVDWKYAKRLKK